MKDKSQKLKHLSTEVKRLEKQLDFVRKLIDDLHVEDIEDKKPIPYIKSESANYPPF